MTDSNINKTLKEIEALYLDGKFDLARDKLLAIRSELPAGHFHYNLGTLLAKENQIGAARYNLEKAKREGFNYPGLDKNLNSVVKVIQSPTKSTMMENVLGASISASQGLVLFFCITLILIITLLKKAKIIKRLGVYFLLVAVSLSPLALKSFYLDKKYSVAINIKESAILEGPSEIYSELKKIPMGQKLILSKSFEEWMLIAYPPEFSGWVKRDDLGVL